MTKLTVEVFEQMLDDVVEWNKYAGNDVTDKSLIPTYLKLSREEFFGDGELLQSWFNNDEVGTLDGLCDLVFTYGYLSQLQGDDEELFDHDYTIKHRPEDTLEDASSFLILNFKSHMKDMLYTLLWVFEDQFDIVGAFKEVLRSNMSKFPLQSEVNIYVELDGFGKSDRYADISYKLVDDRVIFLAGKDKKTGVVFNKPKIIKPSTFSEPSLEEFVK